MAVADYYDGSAAQAQGVEVTGALPVANLPPAQYLSLAVVVEYAYELFLTFGPIEVRA